MDLYHIWFNLEEGVRDNEFVDDARAYFEHLREAGRLQGYRISWRGRRPRTR